MSRDNTGSGNPIPSPDSVAFPADRKRQIRNILYNLETLTELLPLQSEKLLLLAGAIRDLPAETLTKLDEHLKQLLDHAEKRGKWRHRGDQ